MDVCADLSGGALLRTKVADTGIGIPDAARSACSRRSRRATLPRPVATEAAVSALPSASASSSAWAARSASKAAKAREASSGSPSRSSSPAKPSAHEPSALNPGRKPDSPKAIPVDRARPAPTTRPQRRVASIRSSTEEQTLRILVVDDNFVNQQVAAGLLNKLGHRADVADDGDRAVELVATGDYDMVLMDIQMPRVDGLSATGLIRQLPAPQNAIAIVAVTANAMVGDRETCLSAGMDDYISKPINRHQLGEILDRWRERLRRTPKDLSPRLIRFPDHRVGPRQEERRSHSVSCWTL